MTIFLQSVPPRSRPIAIPSEPGHAPLSPGYKHLHRCDQAATVPDAGPLQSSFQAHGDLSLDDGQIRAGLERQGLPIGVNDLHIAAHARSEGLTLVSNNLREFQRVEGLLLENWAR